MSQEVIEITEREIEVIEVVEKGPAGPTGPQPNINYEVVSSARTLEAADLIAADTSGGAFTLTLPANPSAGDAVDIFDYSETFDTNPLTIARNGENIESIAEDLICNVEGAYFTIIYTGSTRGWQILPKFGVSNVTSVGVSGSDGIEVDSGSPVTGAGTIALGVNAATLRSHINVADGAEVNVQSNWTEADSGSDAFILNKPTLGTAAAQDSSAFAAASHTHPLSDLTQSSANPEDLITYDEGWKATDPATWAGANILPSDISAAAASHTHGNLSNDGKIGSTSGLPLKTGTSGVVEAGAFGTSAGQFAEGNHIHDDRYYTETETDTLLSGKAPTNLVGSPVEYVIACSDETTALTYGTVKVTFRAPIAFQLTSVSASVTVAPTGSTLVVDINNGANSALSTKLSIDASEKTSATAATAAVIDTTYDDFSADAEITIDIDQIGSTVAGAGLKVILRGTRL